MVNSINATNGLKDVIYRRANESDIAQIIRIDHLKRNEYIHKTVNLGECHVAVLNNIIIGFAMLNYTFFGCGFIELLNIDPEYRRRGVGGALILYLFQLCETAKLFTSTNESNIPMRNLLAKIGFLRCGFIDELDEGDPELIYVKKKTT
jgi:GNAT superfamily N-acetyltransferase